MRSKERLYDFYDELAKLHAEKVQDWRVGQFWMNFFGWLYQEYKIDPFFPEEDAMMEYIKEYLNGEK